MILRWSISCILLAGRVARPVASLAWMELCEAQIVLVMGDKILQTGKAKVSLEFGKKKIFRFKSNGAPMAEKPVWPPWLWLLRIGALPVTKEVKVVASIGISRLKRRCDWCEFNLPAASRNFLRWEKHPESYPFLKSVYCSFFLPTQWLRPKTPKGSGGASSQNYIKKTVSGIW